jgi:integrase
MKLTTKADRPKWKIQMKTIPQIISSLPPDAGDVVVWDLDLHGFGLRIQRSPRGLRLTFVIQYRTHAGRSRRMTIAPGDMPADKARKLAATELGKVRTGGDPQGAKMAQRRGGSHVFKKVAEDFIASKALPALPEKPKQGKTYWRKSTLRQYRQILLDLSRSLHGLDISAIKRADISAVVRRVEDRNGVRMAALTRTRLQTMFTWAMREGLTESNPAVGARIVEYNTKRERILSDDEIARVWRACSDPANFPRDGNFGRVVKLLLLTGARRKEITGMKHDEINLEDGVWILPGERAKNHRKLILPLSPPAQAILKELLEQKRWNGRIHTTDQFLFSTFGGMNTDRPLKALYKASDTQGWWLHDLRKTVATGLGNLGIAPHVISCVLNHASVMRLNLQGVTVNVQGPRTGITGKYNLSPYFRDMEHALDRWAEHVMALVEGRADKVARRSIPRAV